MARRAAEACGAQKAAECAVRGVAELSEVYRPISFREFLAEIWPEMKWRRC
jgi:hypothetical protein